MIAIGGYIAIVFPAVAVGRFVLLVAIAYNDRQRWVNNMYGKFTYEYDLCPSCYTTSFLDTSSALRIGS